MGDEQTISEAIGNDHKTIDSYADKIKSSSTLEEKIQWRNQFTWALARHAVSEELTMYPTMEKHMGQEGTDLTNLDREQHQAVSAGFHSGWDEANILQVKEDLYKLQSMSPDDRQFSPLLEQLLKDLHTHIEHESNEDMPRLEQLLSREESQDLASQFQRTKMILPTRSHPYAPNQPYFENFGAMLAAPIDKFADLLRSFPPDSQV